MFSALINPSKNVLIASLHDAGCDTMPYADGYPYNKQIQSDKQSRIDKSCSINTTYLLSSSSTIVLIVLAISMRCLTSKYEVGSSKKYTSTSFMMVIAIANRCNSPPDRSLILRSIKWFNSRRLANSSFLFRSSTLLNTSPTNCSPNCPLFDLGSESTYCGLSCDFSLFLTIRSN